MVAQAELMAYAEEMRRAAEGADEPPEQWERLRRRLAPHPHSKKPRVAELCRAYEELTGTRIGCD